MASNAYIKLGSQSIQQEVTLDDVRNVLKYYQEITQKTGHQLGWHYGKAAFPYEFAETSEGEGNWFYLRATDKENYRYIALAVDSDQEGNDGGCNLIQVTLPDNATHGDKGKANEFCKFLAKKFHGELQLFNGRIMNDYKR